MPRPRPMERTTGRRLIGTISGRPTHRQELAARLWIYYCVYAKRPESYNPIVGLGRLKKSHDRPFTGRSIITDQFHHDSAASQTL